MNRQLMTHTAQAYFISLNVITKNNGNVDLLPINIIQLTQIIFALWSIRQTVNRQVDNSLNFCEMFYETNNQAMQRLQNSLHSVFRRGVYSQILFN